MKSTCNRCGCAFECDPFVGYCQDCQSAFKLTREGIAARQRPSPNVFADGKFAGNRSPESVEHPVSGERVCGLCGSNEIEQGYGLGSGYGMGSYTFCQSCYAFLDFREDVE